MITVVMALNLNIVFMRVGVLYPAQVAIVFFKRYRTPSYSGMMWLF